MYNSESLIIFLVKSGIIKEQNLKLYEKIKHDISLADIALVNNIDEKELLTKVSNQVGIEFIELQEDNFNKQSHILLSEDTCKTHNIIPVENTENELIVACNNPLLNELKQSIEFEYNKPIIFKLALSSQISKNIDRVFKNKNKYAGTDDDNKNIEFITKEEDITDINIHDAKTPPVIRLCNTIIADAIEQNASDIHFEPLQDEVSIRFRIDGALVHIFDMPKRLQLHVSTRFKLLSNMDISEKRRPQDGAIHVNFKDSLIDIRSSSIPTPYGEKIVMRILNNKNNQFNLKDLGMEKNLLETFERDLLHAGKLILVTGPTGSGKTTTLYAALKTLNNGANNIQTVEDPIEYRLKDITQIQVNNQIDVTFAKALKSILRQDPDIIMLGEIRDTESAEIALQAAHTGHQVLSTLHTNDAISSITRLRKLGIDDFIIATSLQGIMAQRLVRKICSCCKDKLNEEEIIEQKKVLDTYNIDYQNLNFVTGRGCETCNFSGFKGRLGVYSYLHVDSEIESLIVNNRDNEEIIKVAKEKGFITLEESALEIFYKNETTLSEVIPYLSQDISSVDNTKNTPNKVEDDKSNDKVESLKKKILLVEDDENVRMILKLMLQKEMYTVIEAENGSIALEKIYSEVPDIILSDLMMPIMDGRQLLLKVKSNKDLSHIPFVILTAANTEDKEIELLELGADDFVGKTSGSEVMLTRLRKQLS